jgi:hypothetical protein
MNTNEWFYGKPGSWPDGEAAPAEPVGELRWTEREREVLAELAKKSDVSEFVILRQGLRVQQLLIEGTHKLVEVASHSRAGCDECERDSPITEAETVARELWLWSKQHQFIPQHCEDMDEWVEETSRRIQSAIDAAPLEEEEWW